MANENAIHLNADGSLDQRRIDLISAWESATISSGSVTFSASSMTLDTQSGAASDDLDSIAIGDGETGTLLLIRSTSAARRIVVKHLIGNIWAGAIWF